MDAEDRGGGGFKGGTNGHTGSPLAQFMTKDRLDCFTGIGVKTGSSRSGTDERGKCDNVGLSAACPSNEATIHSVVVAVA